MADGLSMYHWVLALAAIPIVFAAISDICSFTIPNGCSLALIALYPFYVIVSPVEIAVTWSVLTAAFAFAVCFGLYLLGKLGGGDVKLISVLALWAGPMLIAEYLVATALAGGLMAVLMLSPAKPGLALLLERSGYASSALNVMSDKLPYGLAIASGGLVVLVQNLVRWG